MSVWRMSSADHLKVCFHFQKAGQPGSQNHRSPFGAGSECRVKLVPYLNKNVLKKKKRQIYKLDNEMDLLERLQKQKRSQYIGIRFTYFIEK